MLSRITASVLSSNTPLMILTSFFIELSLCNYSLVFSDSAILFILALTPSVSGSSSDIFFLLALINLSFLFVGIAEAYILIELVIANSFDSTVFLYLFGHGSRLNLSRGQIILDAKLPFNIQQLLQKLIEVKLFLRVSFLMGSHLILR